MRRNIQTGIYLKTFFEVEIIDLTKIFLINIGFGKIQIAKAICTVVVFFFYSNLSSFHYLRNLHVARNWLTDMAKHI